MSLTGIGLNHPELIAGFSVSGRWLPDDYAIQNWNRGALVDLVWSEANPDRCVVGGRLGMFASRDGGRAFEPAMAGDFPESRYYRKTYDLFRWSEKGREFLLAATDGGLFVSEMDPILWREIPLGGNARYVRKIVGIGNQIVAFTKSAAFQSPRSADDLRFTPLPIARNEAQPTVTLIRLVFDLHDGSVWGLAGRLLFDIAALALFFLSITAAFIWWFPRWKKRLPAAVRKRLVRWFGKLFREHLRVGIWSAAVLLIVAGTGFLMRPPPVALIVGKSVSRFLYPGPLPHGPWDEKIQNATYDPARDRLLIQAVDGVWAGPPSFDQPFERIALPIPIFVMGARVFDAEADGDLRVGSFAGLFKVDGETGRMTRPLNGGMPGTGGPDRPGRFMATGYLETPEGGAFLSDYRMGLIPLDGAKRDGRFQMPPEMTEGFRMSLWNVLFEIHNVRIFRPIIGPFYILVIPLAGLLFLIVLGTGLADWIARRR